MKKVNRIAEWEERRRPMATRGHSDGLGAVRGLAFVFLLYAGVALMVGAGVVVAVAWRMGDGLSTQWWALLHCVALFGALCGVEALRYALRGAPS